MSTPRARARAARDPSLNTPEQRLARLETATFGIDGRGGVMDALQELSDRLDKMSAVMQRAGWALFTATAALLSAILTHTL